MSERFWSTETFENSLRSTLIWRCHNPVNELKGRPKAKMEVLELYKNWKEVRSEVRKWGGWAGWMAQKYKATATILPLVMNTEIHLAVTCMVIPSDLSSVSHAQRGGNLSSVTQLVSGISEFESRKFWLQSPCFLKQLYFLKLLFNQIDLFSFGLHSYEF